MPKKLKHIAQEGMDLFYQNFKSDAEFWEISDVIALAGNAASAIYTEFYQQEYAMLRSEGKDDVVAFDTGWLDEQILEIKQGDGFLIADFINPIMAFPYDRQSVGVQNVFIEDPLSIYELERTSISAIYQLKYVPITNKIWFCKDRDRLILINKGTCEVKKIKVLYVPSMNKDANVPEGIAERVLTETFNLMRQAADKTVVKKSLDQNVNKVLETEIDKKALK
jgi:hypothetical protein